MDPLVWLEEMGHEARSFSAHTSSGLPQLDEARNAGSQSMLVASRSRFPEGPLTEEEFNQFLLLIRRVEEHEEH